MADRVVLVDGSALIYRAFFAIPANFSTSGGLPTNAIYGFALMFRKILAGKTPKYGAVIWDAPGGTFREKEFPDYKAQRPKMDDALRTQIPHIHKLVETHDFPSLKLQGYEADDLIGTLTRQARAAGHEVHIISGDKDFAQLIDDGVRMVDTMRDVTFDAEVVRKKWGVRPDQFVDLLALWGDKVDNIPGVPGIGLKGAGQLLEKYDSLEGILEHVEELTGRKKTALTEHRDQALLSQKLATIDCAVPLSATLDDLVLPPVDGEKVNALYRELEFFSLIEGGEQVQERIDASDYVAVDDLGKLLMLLEELPKKEPVSLFAVAEQPGLIHGALVGIALGLGPGKARYIPVLGDTGLGENALNLLRMWLQDPERPKVIHNVRDVWTLFRRHDIELRGATFDVALASFLIDPTKNIPHRMDQVVRQWLHRSLADSKPLIGSGKKERLFREVPVAEVSPWACHIASALSELYPLMKEDLEKAGQSQQMSGHDLPLSRVLGTMQVRGIRVDSDVLLGLQKEFAVRKEAVEERIYELAGRTFNIGSQKQLGAVLFDELGLPVIKRTKTGYSTNAEVLERLESKHPIAPEILRWRSLAKLINTYTQVLRDAVSPVTGRVHATLQQTVGVSGRLISTDPDLQRTPIRTEDGKRIREAFVPQEGWRMISADWSQIELRVMAHVCGDPRLIRAFAKKEDIHSTTAAQIYGVKVKEVTREQRNVGKTVNFATIYGQGATALGQQLGITRKEAVETIERYFTVFSEVKAWKESTVKEAYANGYVETLLGRRRYIPELSSGQWAMRGYGERIATNTPIQGSAADLCKLAMIEIDRRLQGMQTRMLLQIHDELLFESPPDEVDAAVAMIREVMENPHPLSVPLVVDIGVGDSWAAAH
jgi:DNA polymerase I